jgi:hypothetical protein
MLRAAAGAPPDEDPPGGVEEHDADTGPIRQIVIA